MIKKWTATDEYNNTVEHHQRANKKLRNVLQVKVDEIGKIELENFMLRRNNSAIARLISNPDSLSRQDAIVLLKGILQIIESLDHD